MKLTVVSRYNSKTFDLATRYPSHHGKFPPVKGARARPPDANKLASELNKVRAESSEAKSVVDQARQQNNSQQEMELSVMRKQGLCFGPEAWLTRIVGTSPVHIHHGSYADGCDPCLPSIHRIRSSLSEYMRLYHSCFAHRKV